MKVDLDILKKEFRTFVVECICEATRREQPPEYLSFDETCKLCRVTRPTLLRWTRKGLLQGFKLNNRRWHYRRADVIAFIEGEADKSAKKQEEKAEQKHLWRGFFEKREQAMQDSGRYISVDDFLATLDLAHQRRLLNVKKTKDTKRNDTY